MSNQIKQTERQISLDETILNDADWLLTKHIERFLLLLSKNNPFNINYFKPSIIDFNSFQPKFTNKTAFIYNVGEHWVCISNFNSKHNYYPLV